MKALTFTQSFQAASALPIKLLQCKSAVQHGRINPIHLQLIPTNRCNANCSWCSCRNVDRTEQLDDDALWSIANTFARWGAKAVTITGGGEPTLHPGLPRHIAHMSRLGYKIGLVTNGRILPKALIDVGNHITWIRVSSSNKNFNSVAERAATVALCFPTTDIGISYTVTADMDLEDAKRTALVANRIDNITHVRYVPDLTNIIQADLMLDELERHLEGTSPKFIFQHRREWTAGVSPCYISLLKPVIGADGFVYPCCGIQYAGIEGATQWTMPQETRMCHWRNFRMAAPFDGSGCQKCYYGDYNKVLGLMTTKIGHREFV